MTSKMKPFNVFVQISRIDEDQRIVEGLAFANEVVPGEGGIRLKRSAMEAATADYLENGTVRAMHQAIAAGKPLSVDWTEAGAYLRAKVVDDAEWKKVKEGVYKGFSIGVIPQVMRGKDVEVCRWWDSSLVDVGRDKDAKFECWRVEGVDAEADVDVEVLESVVETAPVVRSLSEAVDGLARWDVVAIVTGWFWRTFSPIQDEEPDKRESAVLAAMAELGPTVVDLVTRGVLPTVAEMDTEDPERALSPVVSRHVIEQTLAMVGAVVVTRAQLEAGNQAITRLALVEDELKRATNTISTLEKERGEHETELKRVKGLLAEEGTKASEALEKVEELKALPRREMPKVSAFAGGERTFTDRTMGAESRDRLEAKQAELAKIIALGASSDMAVAMDRGRQISVLKGEIASLTGEVAFA